MNKVSFVRVGSWCVCGETMSVHSCFCFSLMVWRFNSMQKNCGKAKNICTLKCCLSAEHWPQLSTWNLVRNGEDICNFSLYIFSPTSPQNTWGSHVSFLGFNIVLKKTTAKQSMHAFGATNIQLIDKMEHDFF